VDAVERLKQTFAQEPSKREIIENLQIPMNAETIHRLLGVRFFSEETRYHADNPLPLDVLVVDEASMIDLTLMAKLLNALKPDTKLILLGDKDQLASVEAGAILGELGHFVNAAKPTYSPRMAHYLQATTGMTLPSEDKINAISDSICYLQVSRRFGANPEVGELATTVNLGNALKSWQLLQQYQQHQDKHCGVYLTDFAHYLTNKDDVQQRNSQDEAAVEPVGNVDVFDFTFGNRTEEYDGVSNPNQSDQDVDRPFQFGILFSLGITQRQADDCRNDNCLPAPEGKCRQPTAEQACITGTLNNVV